MRVSIRNIPLCAILQVRKNSEKYIWQTRKREYITINLNFYLMPWTSLPIPVESTSMNGRDDVSELDRLRQIAPSYTMFWSIVQSQTQIELWLESGQDFLFPDRKLTGSIWGNQRSLRKILRSITIADAKTELARYGITQFDKAPANSPYGNRASAIHTENLLHRRNERECIPIYV